jgi:hypothetical protein
MTTMTFTGTLYVQECIECGVAFGMPRSWDEQFRATGQTFYCPAGHSQCYRETNESRLRAQVARLEGQVTAARADRDRARARAAHEERSKAAVRGHLTRIRKRLAAGVCPVPGCTRSGFEHDRLLLHLHDKHPGWCADHEEVLA